MDKFTPVFSDAGKQMLDELIKCYPHPVLLMGETGWGKSTISREAARKRGLGYVALNAHPGMDMGLLVGMWRPTNTQQGISVVWEDGILTRTIKRGGVFLFEELTRAPQESISRLHGVLDTHFRYWSLPEAGVEDIPVAENFWFIATANPAGQGYSTQRLDKALAGRFFAQFEINSPLADEPSIIKQILGGSPIANKMMRVITDARLSKDVRITTRDLVQWATLVKANLTPIRAFELCVVNKYPLADGLRALAEAHFGGE